MRVVKSHLEGKDRISVTASNILQILCRGCQLLRTSQTCLSFLRKKSISSVHGGWISPKEYEWKRISPTFFSGTNILKMGSWIFPKFFWGVKNLLKIHHHNLGNSYVHTPISPTETSACDRPKEPLFVVTALHHQWSPRFHLLRIFGIFHPSGTGPTNVVPQEQERATKRHRITYCPWNPGYVF